MEKFGLSQPQKVLEAAKKGFKMGIFTVGADGKPILPISDINFSFSPENTKTAQILAPAVTHIHNYYHKDIRIEHLSDLCDLSVAYFSRLFKTHMGMSLIPYVTNLRLECACLLLKTTSKSVVTIAYEVGYVDSGYFNKVFKRHIGVSPLQYRYQSGTEA